MTTPDINTQVIADVVLNAIAQLKTKIKGCDKAFNKIEESMDKILKNMNKYYKMMMVTKDPTTLFTGFLGDLANGNEDGDDDIDLATIMQVKTIMAEFKKMTQNNPNRKNNPQIDGLFDDIDNIFTMLENEIVE
jgi:ferritin